MIITLSYSRKMKVRDREKKERDQYQRRLLKRTVTIAADLWDHPSPNRPSTDLHPILHNPRGQIPG